MYKPLLTRWFYRLGLFTGFQAVWTSPAGVIHAYLFSYVLSPGLEHLTNLIRAHVTVAARTPGRHAYDAATLDELLPGSWDPATLT